MRLEDVLTGNVKLGPGAAISYNGQVYRGQELKDLIARHKNDLSTEEIQDGSATDPDSDGGKPKSAKSTGPK